MFFNYSAEEIKKDIEEYIKAGCCELCYTPSYAKEVDKILEKDRKIMERLLNDRDNRVLFVNVVKYIDKERTTRKKRAFNDDAFMANACEIFGDDAEEFLWKVDARWQEENGEVFYGRGLQGIGKNGWGGNCRALYPDNCVKNDTIIYYGTNDNTSESALLTFYHECGHALQKRFSDQGNEDFQMVWEFQNKGMKFEPQSEIGVKFCNALEYLSYFKESHAETFSAAVLLLKCNNEEEFRCVCRNIHQYGARKISSGLGKKGKAAYNFYPMALSLIRHLGIIGKEGRQKFLDKNGDINFLKVNTYTAEIVRKKAYTQAEFKTYSKFDRARKVSEFANDPNCKRWVEDYVEAEEFQKNCRLGKKGYFDDLLLALKNEPDKKNILLHLQKGENETEDLRKVFYAYNSLPQVEKKYHLRTNEIR